MKISFWSSDGIEIDSDDCEVELKDLQPITVRVIARCTTTEQSPTVDKRIIPTIEGGHSPFWNRSFHLPSVAVSVLLINSSVIKGKYSQLLQLTLLAYIFSLTLRELLSYLFQFREKSNIYDNVSKTVVGSSFTIIYFLPLIRLLLVQPV